MVNGAKKQFVDSFLAWKLPPSVRCDECVTLPEYIHPRYGTHVFTATETEQLFDQLVLPFVEDMQKRMVTAIQDLALERNKLSDEIAFRMGVERERDKYKKELERIAKENCHDR
jgi:hypothetical protein